MIMDNASKNMLITSDWIKKSARKIKPTAIAIGSKNKPFPILNPTNTKPKISATKTGKERKTTSLSDMILL